MGIVIGRADCVNVSRATSLEWLDTNGIGGYASSTALCCHTRRYHGLLVARLSDPPGKFVLLSNTDDALFLDKQEIPLSAFKFQAVVHPAGHQNMKNFELGLTPTFRFSIGPIQITKRIALVQGEDTVLLRYVLRNNQPLARLRIKPLFGMRDFHALTHENIFLRPRTWPCARGFLFSPYEGMPTMHLQASLPFEFVASPAWYRNFEYFKESRRGFDCNEDLFCPGLVEFPVPEGETPIVLSISTRELDRSPADCWEDELQGRDAFRRALKGSERQRTLARSAFHFFSRLPSGGMAITAGFPWFVEWGRDAMIALPGLTLAAPLEDKFLPVLATYKDAAKDGMIPNFLGWGGQENAYNAADATLWFAWAAQQYLLRTGDHKGLVQVVFDFLKTAYCKYRDGTGFGIYMRQDGLLQVGSPEVQVTWMDAQVDGQPVTPRNGSPVEINALWYNLIGFLAELCDLQNDPLLEELKQRKEQLAASFNQAFWVEDGRHLADVVRGENRDTTTRPNQLLAVSLPHSPLDPGRQHDVFLKVKKHLLTPWGLRTLAPRNPGYRPRYAGGPRERDQAYHNGTVWPWWLCHYGEAAMKVAVNRELMLSELEEILAGFDGHLKEICLGSVSEVFDGDPPHFAHGCPSQAWSVAELLRLQDLVDQARNPGKTSRKKPAKKAIKKPAKKAASKPVTRKPTRRNMPKKDAT